MTFVVPAASQSLNGVRLRASPATLERLKLQTLAREGQGAIKMSKFELPNGNPMSVTYDSSAEKILFVEVDWNNDSSARETGIPKFVFGKTTLEQIREINGSNGFSWRKVAMQRKGDQLIALNAYEIRNKPNSVVVFVTALSIPEFEATSSDTSQMPKLFRLQAVILATEQYLDFIWGAEKVYDNATKTISWAD